MILDELVLDDFGPYRGRQRMDLTPPETGEPIILIGGLNGGGKTSLMDAIQLCLFGKFANCSNRGNLSYKEYLRRCINWEDEDKDTTIELEFRHVVDGKEERIRLQRGWSENGKSVNEVFRVFRNGLDDKFLAENWTEAVERILPRQIAQLALFDGEKIETYADPEAASGLIRTATHSLLGMDIVDQLEKDLSTLRQRKRRGSAYSDLLQEEEEAEKTFYEIDDQLKRVCIASRQIRTADLPEKQDALSAIEEEFEQKGGRLFDQRKEIEAELQSIQAKIREAEREIRGLVGEVLPLALVEDLLKKVGSRAQEEHRLFVRDEVLRVCDERDQQVLSELSEHGLDQHSVDTIREVLARHRSEGGDNTGEEPYLNLSNAAHDDIRGILSAALPDAKRRAGGLSKHIDDLQGEASQREAELASVPAEETVEELVRRREEVKGELARLEDHLRENEAEEARLKNKRERAKQHLLQLKEKRVGKDLEKEDQIRVLNRLDRVQSTLDVFRDRAVRKHIAKIETSIRDSFRTLLRKTNLIAGLKIDPDAFSLCLSDVNGRQLTPERLSAGERQLMSVSILWGLAQASARNLPTVIDTPLGRLDSEHRANIIQKYFPNASHQVLLLSTDQEIESTAEALLAPYIGKAYHLDFDAERGSTVIRPGYFSRELQDAG